MVPICHKFWFFWVKIYIFFFTRKVRGSFLALCVLRYYTINRRGRSNTIKRGKRVSFLIFINLEKGLKKGCKYNKLKFSNPTQKGKFLSYCVSFWRHGRVVRRGTANPFSPVQIRVPPHQQTNRNILFCSADITQPNLTQQNRIRGLLILGWF